MSPSISFITSWRRSSSILRSASVRGLALAVFVIEGDTSALDAGALAFALAFAFTTVFAVAFAVAFTAWRGLAFAVMRAVLLPESDSWLSPPSRARSCTSASGARRRAGTSALPPPRRHARTWSRRRTPSETGAPSWRYGCDRSWSRTHRSPRPVSEAPWRRARSPRGPPGRPSARDPPLSQPSPSARPTRPRRRAPPGSRPPRSPRRLVGRQRRPTRYCGSLWRSVLDQGLDLAAFELFAPFERAQLQQKGQPDDLPAELAHQVDRRGGRSAGREQVVHDKHPLAHRNRVPVHRQRVGAILQIILDLEDVGRQLAGSPDRHEAGVELKRQRSAQDKPARLDADDLGHVAVPVERGEVSDDAAERPAVLEQRRDVIEQDPGFGEIRNLTNELFVIHKRVSIGAPRKACQSNFYKLLTAPLHSRIVKPWTLPVGVFQVTDTSVTAESDGPRRSRASSSSTFARGPSTSTCTRPS